MNNYVFPELPQYKKGWVPVLEMAKLALNQEDFQEDFPCTAVSTGNVVTSHDGTVTINLGTKDEAIKALRYAIERLEK